MESRRGSIEIGRLIAICLIAISMVMGCSKKGTPTVSHPDYSRFADRLEAGDIVIRCGLGPVSAGISMSLKDTIEASHCGIVVPEAWLGAAPDSEPDFGLRFDSSLRLAAAPDSASLLVVVHTISGIIADVDGMQSCSISEFYEESKKGTIRIARLKNVELRQPMAKVAAELYLRKTPFDLDMDMADTSRMFCSEVPVFILNHRLRVEGVLPPGADMRSAPKFSIFLNRAIFEQVDF